MSKSLTYPIYLLYVLITTLIAITLNVYYAIYHTVINVEIIIIIDILWFSGIISSSLATLLIMKFCIKDDDVHTNLLTR